MFQYVKENGHGWTRIGADFRHESRLVEETGYRVAVTPPVPDPAVWAYVLLHHSVCARRASGEVLCLARSTAAVAPGASMGYLENMQTVRMEIPADLVVAAGLDADNLSAEATRLLALELYREDRVSLGRAAELCRLPVEQFMEFASRHDVPLHYGADDLEQDRRTLERLGL